MIKHLILHTSRNTILPYSYFIGLAAFWFFGDLLAVRHLSYVPLAVMIVLAVQAVKQFRALGACIGVLSTTGSFLAFLAVLSEFNDFEVVNTSALSLIAVGSILSLTGLAMGVLLIKTNLQRLAL